MGKGRKVTIFGLIIVLLVGLVACGAEEQEFVEELAPTVAAGATEVSVEVAVTRVVIEAEEAPAGEPALGEEMAAPEVAFEGVVCLTEYLPERGLLGGNLQMVYLEGAELGRAYLVAADLTEAILSGVNLSEANLWGAKLVGTNLSRANLTRADLRGANMTGANLMRANLIGAIYDKYTHWPAGFVYQTVGAKEVEGETPPRRPGRLPSNRLCIIEFDLYEGVMAGAYLDGVDLRWAELDGINLHQASLQGADLAWASLQETDLSGTLLGGANLSGARLVEANLQGADLCQTNLSGANLSGADLAGAIYDWLTTWPDRFDPEAAGAVEQES